MPIEVFGPVYSPARTKVQFSGSALFRNVSINIIRDALLSVGWTQVGGIKAGTRVLLPFYFQIATPPPHPVTLTPATCNFPFPDVILDGICFCGYNPYFNTPGIAPCVWYPYADTIEHSLQVLAANLTGNSDYNVHYEIDPVTGFSSLVFEAKVEGPLLNDPELIVSFVYGSGGGQILRGGGWRLRSGLANGKTQYEVEIREIGISAAAFSFKFFDNYGGSAEYLLHTVAGFGIPQDAQYTMVANAYQFAIVDERDALDSAGTFNAGGTSLMASAPFVLDAQNEFLDYCLLIIGPGNLKSKTDWYGQPCSFAVNGPLKTFSSHGLDPSQPSLLHFRYPGPDGLKTVNLKPLLSNSYVMIAAQHGDESNIVGKLWDGLVSSESYSVGAEQLVDGHAWHVISNQPDSDLRTSFWLAYN